MLVGFTRIYNNGDPDMFYIEHKKIIMIEESDDRESSIIHLRNGNSITIKETVTVAALRVNEAYMHVKSKKNNKQGKE